MSAVWFYQPGRGPIHGRHHPGDGHYLRQLQLARHARARDLV